MVDDVELLLRAALDGVGLVFMAEQQVQLHGAGGTPVRVMQDWCPPFPGYFLYYPSRRQQPATLLALIETPRLRAGAGPRQMGSSLRVLFMNESTTIDGQLMTTTTLDIQFGNVRVPVFLGTGAAFDLTATGAIRALAPDRVLLVVDAAVAHLYPAEVRRFAGLGSAPGVVFVAPEGERCKSFATLQEVIETFLRSGATKRSLVLVFGGGAVMNLGGLAAALIYRGIRLCYVPTTLMAQNDVVPSMKTAINGCDRKNNIGTFYPASLSVVDTRYLDTLPAPELRAGMGELVKNALILGGEYFTIAERMLDAHEAGAFEDGLLAGMVESGIRAKLPTLSADPREATRGMIFEYGHTVGHALELCYPPGALPHGLAICWGMRCCSYIASHLGLMNADEVARHDGLIQRLVPEPLPRPVPALTDVMQRVMHDSKRGNAGEAPHECACVLLRAVGEPVATDTMLSKFPSALVADWLRDQGLRG